MEDGRQSHSTQGEGNVLETRCPRHSSRRCRDVHHGSSRGFLRESGQPPAQGEPPGGFVCSFMRALLHVLDRGREFSVASPLSTLLPMASQPSEMSSCNWMMRRSDCGTLAGKLVDASPVGL